VSWTRIAVAAVILGGLTWLTHRYIWARLVRDAMMLCFLMERRYAPYIKWLGTAFAQIDVRRRVDSLWVSDAAALVDYAQSMSSAATSIDGEGAAALGQVFQDRIDADGGIHITKDAGVVLAWLAS